MSADRNAPYRVMAFDDEDLATWWGPFDTLQGAREALAEVKKHAATNGAKDPFIRDVWRHRLDRPAPRWPDWRCRDCGAFGMRGTRQVRTCPRCGVPLAVAA